MPTLVADRFVRPERPEMSGAHGALYKAVDMANESRPVALKVFKPDRILDDRILRLSWTNELEAYQQLGEHENLVGLVDWGRHEDAPYLAFEWVGKDLLESLPALSIEGWDDLWPVLRDVLSGLDVLHRHNFVHRDLKPENVLVSDANRYKIADFGTTRLVETISIGVTMAPLGTEPYAPPERGTRTPSPSYDVYSVAMLVTQCLNEQSIINAPHDEFRKLDLPADIRKVLERCLEENPEDRPESAGVLLAELTRIQRVREDRRGEVTDLFLDLIPHAINGFASTVGCDEKTAKSRIVDDMIDPVVAFDLREQSRDPDLQIVGQTLMLRATEHRTRPGVLRVVRISRPPAQILEYARSNWHRPAVALRLTAPMDVSRATATLREFLQTISDQDALRAERNASASEEHSFRTWRAVLKA